MHTNFLFVHVHFILFGGALKVRGADSYIEFTLQGMSLQKHDKLQVMFVCAYLSIYLVCAPWGVTSM